MIEAVFCVKFKKWELALAVALIIVMLMAVMPFQTQAELARKMVRLHVIANSDSPEDQMLKLAVRDRVLTEAGTEDAEINDALLERMRRAAADEIAERGFGYTVRGARLWLYRARAANQYVF